MYRFDSVCALSGWGQTGSDRHFNTDLSGIFIYFLDAVMLVRFISRYGGMEEFSVT